MAKAKAADGSKTKCMLKTTDALWNRVLKYKIDNKKKNVNEAVVDLIEKGLR